MKTVPMMLLHSLQELQKEEFKNFRWQLKDGVAKGYSPIAWGKLVDAKDTDLVDLMVDQYGTSEAGNIAVTILKNIGHNNLAEKLKKELGEGQGDDKAADEGASATLAPAPKVHGISQNIKADESRKYGMSEAGNISATVLKNIGQNYRAEELKKKLGEGQGDDKAADEGASNTLAPAPKVHGISQNIKAESGGKVNAPGISGATFNNSVNFTFN